MMASTAAPAAPSKEWSGIMQGRGWHRRRAAFPLSALPADDADAAMESLDVAVAGTRPVARAGDLIIVQERYDAVSYLVLSADGVLHNRYGRFLHSGVIGKQLGMRWEAVDVAGNGGRKVSNGGRSITKGQSSKGFIYALAPTPALWSMAMYHRTQVVYPTDSSIIALYLDLRPGSVIVESGTGAGSASVAFARTVAPHGRVMSFEFHKERAEAARAEFETLGLSDVICVHAGHDVLATGFKTVTDGSADAVFLDLPAPYHVITEVARVLRPDGALCSFSPCIEQVQRTCEELRAGPFHSIRTLTAPTRTYETRMHSLEAPGFDELSSNAPAALSSQDGNAESEGVAADAANGTAVPASKKRKRMAARTAAGERTALQKAAAEAELAVATGKIGQQGPGGGYGGLVGRVVRPTVRVKSRAFPEMKGHTSYLTFARRTRESMSAAKANNGGTLLPSDPSNCGIV
jgi:tRNA (adenine57-N1/adenine58-N1)-methyltransferase catalytic subunit